jgi:hypothetical protein
MFLNGEKVFTWVKSFNPIQFLLALVLRHVTDYDLLAGGEAADDFDVVVVVLAEADLAGMEE